MVWMANSVVHVIDRDPEARATLDELFASVHLRATYFASVPDALRSIGQDSRGCLIVNCDIDNVDAGALPDRLQADGVELPVIFTSERGDVGAAVGALKAGAFDFLERPINGQVLIDTVNEAFIVDRSGWQARRTRRELRHRFDQLTPREWDVVGPMVRGLSNREIASHLELSPKTVEVYRARILAKSECRNLPELVRTAIRCRLIEELEES